MSELPSSSNCSTNESNGTFYQKNITKRIVEALRERKSTANILDLIKLACDVKVIDEFHMLHVAIIRPTIDVAHELIKLGVDINAQNKDGYTALYCARMHARLEAVALLLYYGANVHICSPFEVDFHIKFYTSDSDVVKKYYDQDEVLSSLGFEAYVTPYYNTNANCLKNSWYPLLVSMKKGDFKLFKLIWSKIDQEVLADFRLVLLGKFFLSGCQFSTSEWLEGLYIILQCSDVIQSFYYKYPCSGERLFTKLIQECYQRDLECEERMGLIYTFLSLGLKVTAVTVDLLYHRYGFNEELEAILHCGGFELNKCDFVMTRFVVIDDPTVEEIYHYFSVVYGPLYDSVTLILNTQTLLKMVKYFWTPNREHYCIYDQEEVRDKMLKLPNIPSLVELSRNQVRNHIQQHYKIRKPYQFYDVVKRLRVPQLFQDIISMKEPIYP